MPKTSLIELDHQALINMLGDLSILKQNKILQAIHKHHAMDPLSYDFLKKDQRAILNQLPIAIGKVIHRYISKDHTIKWLISFDGPCIETVYIPEKNRATLCISSQVGCGLNCSFCATGYAGFSRNLTAGEIIAQLYHAKAYLLEQKLPLFTNVVFMGMGEALLNTQEVIKVINFF